MRGIIETRGRCNLRVPAEAHSVLVRTAAETLRTAIFSSTVSLGARSSHTAMSLAAIEVLLRPHSRFT